METNQSKDFNNLGVQHFMKGEISQAKSAYLMALEQNSKNTTSLNNLGLLYHHLKDFEAAIDLFQRAIALEKKPVYFLNLGNSLAMKGHIEKAQAYYLEATKLDPSYSSAWVSLAKLAAHRSQWPNAVGYWNNALETNPNPEYVLELAKALVNNQEIEKALNCLSNLDPSSNPEIWFQIGRCEFLLRNHGLAEKALKNALAESPDHLDFRKHLALNFLASGQFNEGINQLDILIKLYPNNHEVLTEKGVVLCGISDFDNALFCFDQALRLKPTFEKALHYKNLIASKITKKTESGN